MRSLPGRPVRIPESAVTEYAEARPVEPPRRRIRTGTHANVPYGKAA
ncbi:hypothetical protein [Streptomyces sp. NPDC058045]